MQAVAFRSSRAACSTAAQRSATLVPVVGSSSSSRRPAQLHNSRAVVAGATKGSKAVGTKVVTPEPSLNLPLALLAISGASAAGGVKPLAVIAGILGVFLAIQSQRVKFQFEPDALEVVVAGKEEESTENKFVGGRNRWRYDTFINWELWWPGFPILVYFKERQTKPEGQIHFFPVIFNGKQVYDVMVERCGPSQTSGPK